MEETGSNQLSLFQDNPGVSRVTPSGVVLAEVVEQPWTTYGLRLLSPAERGWERDDAA